MHLFKLVHWNPFPNEHDRNTVSNRINDLIVFAQQTILKGFFYGLSINIENAVFLDGQIDFINGFRRHEIDIEFGVRANQDLDQFRVYSFHCCSFNREENLIMSFRSILRFECQFSKMKYSEEGFNRKGIQIR